MRRFALLVILYTAAATVLWWLAHDPASRACVATAKALHALVGYPAPYLIAEIADLWWLAPPAQLLIGLILASHWLSWRRRIALLAAALAIYWFVAAMTVIITASPYVGLPTSRRIVGLLLTKGLLVIIPLILWGILVGRSLSRLFAATVKNQESTDSTVVARSQRTESGDVWKGPLSAAALALLLPVAALLMAGSATSEIKDARRQLAAALRGGEDRISVARAVHLVQLEQAHRGHDLPLIYLSARLCQQIGDLEAARRLLAPVRNQPILAPLRLELGG